MMLLMSRAITSIIPISNSNAFDLIYRFITQQIVIKMNRIAYVPPLQPAITVADLMNHPKVKKVANKVKWSRIDKNDVASVLKNRSCVDARTILPEDSATFSKFWAKVEKLCDSDPMVTKSTATAEIT
jgi:hypothetical protein